MPDCQSRARGKRTACGRFERESLFLGHEHEWDKAQGVWFLELRETEFIRNVPSGQLEDDASNAVHFYVPDDIA